MTHARVFRGLIVTMFMGTVAAAGTALSASPKLSATLQRQLYVEKSASVDVLVYMHAAADLKHAKHLGSKQARARFVQRTLRDTAADSQQALLKFLGQRKSRTDFQSYYIANAVAVYGADLALIESLAERSDVARIVANHVMRILPAPVPGALTEEDTTGIGDNIRQTGADRVWSELSARGAGIVVAGQDTGIDWDHPALLRSYRGKTAGGVDHNYNWHDAIRTAMTSTANPCGYATREPCDDHGHGTHTLGTVIGSDGGTNDIGMAPDAKWIGCRNMDEGNGRPSTYIECFQFFLAPWPYGGDPATDGDPERGADVINNSWGCTAGEGCDGTEFLPVLNALRAAGVMVVVSAGNDGSSCSTIQDGPAHHSAEVFSVGAMDHRSGNIASFSSRGPSKFDGAIGPDITAPGVSIRSSIPGGGYSSAMWSGTSMAGPHVAGAVALLWSLDPALKGQITQTEDILRQTATPKTTTQTCGGVPGSAVPNNTYGHGNLDVYRAATAARR